MAMAMASFSVASSSSLLHPPRLAPPSPSPSLPAPVRLARPAAHRLGSRLPSQTASDIWRPAPFSPSALSSAAVVEVGQTEECSTGGASASSLKRSLLDSLHSAASDRGLRASSETRAEIVELIAQLEAINPTPAPTEALTLLDGKWILAYTSFLELFPLLTASTMPLVKVGEISQTIDSTAFTVQNSVSYTGPLATTSFSTTASFEIRSPKRVQIKFEEGVIGTPQLTDSIEIPENVEVLGSKIDLQPVQSFLRSLQDTASSVVKTVSERPPLKIPITSEKAQSWLLTTYLDEDLRISRVDGGSVFVLIKQGSPLLTAAI